MSSPLPGPPSEPIPQPPSSSSSYSVPVRQSSSSDAQLADLRKRRQCKDFGFRRLSLSRPLSDSPSDNSSLATSLATPPGTFTGSDSDSSSIHELPFNFPLPPPLRRMQSSPLDEAAVNRKRGGRARSSTMIQPHVYNGYGTPDSLSDFGADISTSSRFDSACSIELDNSSGELDLENEGETLIMSSPGWPNHSVPPHFNVPSSYRTHVQSVSRSDPPRCGPPHRQISKMRSLKFAPGSSESLDHLGVTMESPGQQRSLLRSRTVSMDFRRPQFSRHGNAGKARGGQSSNPPGLATPFLRHAPHSAPAEYFREEEPLGSGLKSFIDISLDQEVRRNSVKKLLTRASQVFRPSKLSRKKSSLSIRQGAR